jgi:protein FrlC
LANITEHAAQLGLRCLLEPLQRVETNVVLSAADVRRMLDEVGADNLDVVLDTVAMATAGNSVADYVDLFGDRLAHVQLVDGSPAGHLVWGDGTLPLGNYLTDLAVAGYRGKVTFEPFGDGTYALDPVAAWQRNLDGIRPYLVPAAVASA